MMAGHNLSPGVFKSKDAEPEATLELFKDYLKVMECVQTVEENPPNHRRQDRIRRRQEEGLDRGGGWGGYGEPV